MFLRAHWYTFCSHDLDLYTYLTVFWVLEGTIDHCLSWPWPIYTPDSLLSPWRHTRSLSVLTLTYLHTWKSSESLKAHWNTFCHLDLDLSTHLTVFWVLEGTLEHFLSPWPWPIYTPDSLLSPWRHTGTLSVMTLTYLHTWQSSESLKAHWNTFCRPSDSSNVKSLPLPGPTAEVE